MNRTLEPTRRHGRDFFHHQDAYIRGVPMSFRWGRYSGCGPVPASILAKRFVDTWQEHRGLFETMGVAMQQLAEDYPETVAQIQRLRIPVSRYGGVGHAEPAPVGRMRDLSGMTLEESIRAQWEFETRTLIPNWHFENERLVLGNPRAHEPIALEELAEYNLPPDERWLYGGTLAIQVILGVIPLDFRQRTLGGEKLEPTVFPTTAVKRALGMSNWPDPTGSQWDPANHPLEFYKRTYGVDSFRAVREMPCPIEYVLSLMTEEEKERQHASLYTLGRHKERAESVDWRAWEVRLLTQEALAPLPEHLAPQWLSPERTVPDFLRPRERRLRREDVSEIARALVGGTETLSLRMGAGQWSLCDAFQALAFSLERYAIQRDLPAKVTLQDILGPIDYALSENGVPDLPHHLRVLFQAGSGLDNYQRLLGAEGAASRGVPRPCPEVNPVNVLHAAWLAARQVRKWGHVPATIPIYLPLGGRTRGQIRDVRTACNAAEFLVAMARQWLTIVDEGMAMPVRLDPISIVPGGSPATRAATHAAWNGQAAPTPRSTGPSTLGIPTLVEAATYLDERRPRITHDGDYGGPPDYVETAAGCLSLAEAFCGLAAALGTYHNQSALPESVAITTALGPIDYAMYELEREPQFDPGKRIGGWQPYELARECYPPRELCAAQGFIGTGEWGAFEGRATLKSACRAAEWAGRAVEAQGHIPGAIPIILLDEQDGPVEATANAAELLYIMASAYLRVRNGGAGTILPARAVKIVADERCQSVTASTPVAFRGGRLTSDMTMYDIFSWRAPVSRWLLNRAWTYKPQ
jgi:hypothetical protein